MHRPRHVIVLALTLLLVPFGAALPAGTHVPGPLPEPLQDDCATGADAPDVRADALPLSDGQVCRGRLALDDRHDWYSALVPDQGSLQFTISDTDNTRATWCVVKPDLTVHSCRKVTDRNSAVKGLTVSPATGGTWYVHLKSEGHDDLGSYAFQVRLSPPPPAPAPDCGAATDAGASASSALAVAGVPFACAGQLQPTRRDTADVYAFPAAADVAVIATLTLAAGRAEVCLASGHSGETACGYAYSWAPARVYLTDHAASVWHATVRNPSQDLAYTLVVDQNDPADQDDCGTGGDAGNAFADAAPLALPVSCEGTWPEGTGDRADWYSFSAQAGDVFVATGTWTDNGWVQACLYDPSGALHACDDAPYKYPYLLARTLPTAGDWRLAMRQMGSWRPPTTYFLHATLGAVDADAQDDCASGADASWLAASAVALALPADCDGEAGRDAFDLEDWYSFEAASGEPLNVTLTQLAGNADVCLYRPGEGAPTRCSVIGGNWTDRIEVTANRTGTWRLRVATESAASQYRLEVSKTSSQDDCGSGVDAGDDFASATPIEGAAIACAGHFPQTVRDKTDWYSLVVPRAGALVAGEVRMPPFFGAEMCLWRPDATLAACASAERVAHLRHVAEAEGVWRVEVRLRTGGGAYDMALAVA